MKMMTTMISIAAMTSRHGAMVREGTKLFDDHSTQETSRIVFSFLLIRCIQRHSSPSIDVRWRNVLLALEG